jgi:hypothetical protein
LGIVAERPLGLNSMRERRKNCIREAGKRAKVVGERYI